MSQPLYTNKLVTEKSPYLLLHAHTPVNWYPWGEEALDLAASQDKPIFLSIGCMHSRSCRMMLEESFSSPEVAHILNEHFISIKVDKEELPHLVDLYMDLTQMLSVTGEESSFPVWPLNVFLTPDLLPFFSVNYLGAESRLGMPSFHSMVEKVSMMWEDKEERELFVQQAHKVIDVASVIEKCSRKECLEEETVKRTVEAIYQDVDPLYGGVKAFPKVPPALLLHFLLRYSVECQDSRGFFFVDRSLQRMYQGGVFDHLEGGFYVCTVDDRWLIPCFEKRVTDNALLLLDYLDGWACLDRPEYLFVAKHILHYVLSELYDPQIGAFYSSEHSGGFGGLSEGGYPTWSAEEIRHILGSRGEAFCAYYGVSQEGFCGGRNILHIPEGIEIAYLVERYGYHSLEEFYMDMHSAREQLRAHAHRQSVKEDLVISLHNGLMLYSLVYAGRILGEPNYFMIAERCGEFIQNHLRKEYLLRRWRDHEAKYFGGLEDYAAVILGYLSLYEVGCGVDWLLYAEELMKEVITFFHSDSGGFYSTDDRDDTLLFKQESLSDNETISGNALLCLGLIKLHMLTEKQPYLTHVEDVLQLAQARWHTHKFSSIGTLLVAQSYFSREHRKIFISLHREEDRQIILSYFTKRFLPHTSFVWLRRQEQEKAKQILPEHQHCLFPREEQSSSIIYVLEPGIGRKFTNLEDFGTYIQSR